MDRLLRIWVWLTQSREASYTRMAVAVGVTFVVFGVLFYKLARAGNSGLTFVASGITIIVIGLAYALLSRMRR